MFGILPSFEGTRAKLGLGADGVKTTPLSGEPDVLNGPSPEAEQLLQTGVDSIYAASSASSPSRRKKSPAGDRPDRPGPRMGRRHGAPDRPGRRLRRNGRGDRQGGELAKLGDERGVTYLERPPSFKEQLIDMLA